MKSYGQRKASRYENILKIINNRNIANDQWHQSARRNVEKRNQYQCLRLMKISIMAAIMKS
jgi:hypothetical protein